ncbi:MAG: hypothetical protein WC222_07940 [Parachlamydiales bacterium]|jgi:hypothetical protein
MLFRFFLLLNILSIFSALEGLLDSIAVSGNPGTFVFAVPAAGSQPANLVDTSTTYSASTLSLARKITGQLNTNMPTGMTLAIELQAPLIGTSQGSVTMSTTPADLITGMILLTLQSGLQITYTMTATVQASPVTNSVVTVTYTLL